ncbi:putative spermidine/putrescine transport system substrate-binding protein/spermidine/putrescine transport system substrate-binding protein [Crenobacter luteus]|uniref:Putrescine-binding periplasmic protein n=1 Tax=Crenobacter luteus TaxID=1452487 RepID=A0A163C792_9NEIS|nr:spermidine/putrescine ABC transporter substrate-binding protein [Crenobacter luteus]KZE30281.1 spermidine/putrescine ABC transporter substrate-binding protein [Crenobacter luteus]TCP07282.1 putative spermidine/putrescine transport system substrate-binding protein/spermidine/putrescine transport system substrate-binding protein [Crenobacter luteus]
MKKLLLALALASSANVFAADTLHLYNWNNYLSDATAKRFEAACKCKLVQDYYGDNEEMLAKLAAGAKGYDIVVPTGFAVQTLINQKAAAPLDKSKLPNLKNMDPGYLNAFFDKGNQYSVPYAFTTTLLGYNETQLKQAGVLDKANSWALIFDPAVLAKIKGKVTVLDSQRELMAAALMYLGKSANSTNPADWQAARDLILKAKPYWAAFNNQSYIKQLTTGNIWVAFGYSNDMFQAQADAKKAKRPFSIGFSLQKEGNTLSLDNFVVLKDAPRKDLAYQFINFMLDGKNASDLTNEMGSGNPNAAAKPFVKPEIAKVPAIFPGKADVARLQQLQDLNAKQRRDLNRIWSEIKLK